MMPLPAISPVTDGLVFSMGGGVLVDTAGNNTITNSGATLTTDHNGRANRGYVTSAVANKLLAAINWDFARGANGKFSVAFGAKVASSAALFLNLAIGGNTYRGFMIHTDTLLKIRSQLWTAGQSSNANFYYGIGTGLITLNNWFYSIYTFDNSLAVGVKETYNMNGVEGTGGQGLSGTFVSLGTTNGNTEMVVNGNTANNLDSLNIYNKVLTASEKTKLYNYWLSH